MALHGDLKTYPLADLLQWIDASRKPGQLSVTFGGGEWRLYLMPGTVARCGSGSLFERLARLAQLLEVADGNMLAAILERARSLKQLEQAFALAGVDKSTLVGLAREELFSATADLIREGTGSFHYWEDPEGDQDDTAPVDVALRELLYEALRRLDESTSALKVIKNDQQSLQPGAANPNDLTGLPRAALRIVGKTSTVGAVRLALGLSLAEAARILHDLWRSGHLALEGSAIPRPDPLTTMLRQGERLVAEGQYDAAELLFNSLLRMDPSDRRVRDFLRVVEREHVEVLYKQLLPTSVPKLLVQQSALASLRPDERIVAGLVNGNWDVSTIVLASPLRELQTLRALEHMVGMGFLGMA